MPENPLKASVQSQMVTAMKAGDKNRTQVLRMVLSEIKRQEADKPDADPQIAVGNYARTLRKAAADMEKYNQAERVAQLQSEIKIVEEFLPRQAGDADLEKIVANALAALGPLTNKDMGRAIGTAIKAVAAAGLAADAGKVRSLVESKIGP